jgi:thiol-disulfide isomerase/thioredoxin
MKNIILISFLTILQLGFSNIYAQKTGSEHQIEINIEELRDTSLILGHHFNQRMIVDDTTRIDQNGKAVFKGDEPLPEGIYVIYLPNQSYFDLLIGDDQTFKVSVDTSNFVNTMTVEGATETKKFNDYQKFIIDKQTQARKLQQQLQVEETNIEKKNEIQTKLQAINSEVKTHWEKLIEENAGTLLALFLKGIQVVEVPDYDFPGDTQNADSLTRVKRYNYYKSHYFDNIDLTDERLLRTPFFAKKVENYFSNVLPQIPDTLLKLSIEVIEKAKPAPEMFRYLVQYLFNYANDSQIMGMDKMLVGIAEKYYLSGMADWPDEEFMEKLRERVNELKPTLIGNKAHDLKMQANTGEYHRLHEIVAPVTILVFWETDCGHCKTAIPKLNELYHEKLQNKGIKIFAVYTQGDQPEWNEFIEENKLYDFINVWDPYRQTNFRQYYDVKSTPSVFLLDENKHIIGKKISIEDIPMFIDHHLKQNSNQNY